MESSLSRFATAGLVHVRSLVLPDGARASHPELPVGDVEHVIGCWVPLRLDGEDKDIGLDTPMGIRLLLAGWGSRDHRAREAGAAGWRWKCEQSTRSPDVEGLKRLISLGPADQPWWRSFTRWPGQGALRGLPAFVRR